MVEIKQQHDGPLVKRQKVGVPSKSANDATSKGSRIFAPFRVSPRSLKFHLWHAPGRETNARPRP